MRLSEADIESIVNLANLHFGDDVQVFLFGSRANNQQQGGDIDLLIRNPNNGQLKIRAKINFITDLILQIGDQKIDVVLENQANKNSGFLKTIVQTAIRLC